MTKLSTVYDKAFFEWHRPLKDDYIKIAKELASYRPAKGYYYALDIGCGNGYYLEGLPASCYNETTRAYKAGVDGSPHCLKEMQEQLRYSFRLLDVSKHFLLGDRFDLVICSEVGEHLPEECADTLADNIYNHAQTDVFFSAATPGQGGHDHLNEQPHSYWVEKFKERGFVVDEERTKKIREFAATTQLSWIRDNAIIFTRLTPC